MVSLNSVIYVHRPGFDPSRKGDIEQFNWLRDELKSSQANKEQVILTMHVAPSDWSNDPNEWSVKGDWSKKGYYDTFKSILKEYPNVVIGILAAHSEYDELRAFKTSNQQTIPVIFNPGLSTGHGNSSAFKTISVQRDSATSPWHIQNYVTYYFKGYKADSSNIEKFYDFNSSFCPTAKDISFITCLNNQMTQSNGKYVFTSAASKLFSNHYYANPQVPASKNATSWVINY